MLDIEKDAKQNQSINDFRRPFNCSAGGWKVSFRWKKNIGPLPESLKLGDLRICKEAGRILIYYCSVGLINTAPCAEVLPVVLGALPIKTAGALLT